MRKIFVAAVLCVGATLYLSANPSWGANKAAAPPTGTAKAPEAPLIFGVTEVVPRSERALSRLREIQAHLDADTSVAAIGRELPAFEQDLDQWWKLEGATIGKLHSVQRLNEIQWEWARRAGQIEAWSQSLIARSKAWSSEEEALERILANWQSTQAALKKSAPPEVRDKIAEVLRETESTRKLFQAKTARLVAMQNKLAARLEGLSSISRAIEANRARSALDLLRADSAPLWSLLSERGTTASISAQTSASATRLSNDALEFVRLFRERLRLHAAIFAILFALLLRLRFLARCAGGVEPLNSESRVMEHSLSSALLLSLLSVPFINHDASPHVVRIGAILGILPSVVLARAAFSRRTFYGFFLLLIGYFHDLLRFYLPPEWLLARLLLLVVAILGIAGLTTLLWRKPDLPMSASARAVRSLLRICWLLFAGSVAANLSGYVALAEYIASPLVRILFLGVIIHLSVLVATNFVTQLILRAPLLQVSRIVRERGEALAGQFRRLIHLAAVGLWLFVALYNFGVVADLQAGFQNLLNAQWQVGATEIAARDFVNFILVFASAYLFSRVLRVLLADELLPRFQMPRGVPDALELFARYGVLLFGFLLALSSAGVNLSQVTLALSALGVGIGFGLQSVVNNFVSGLILVFEHPIQVGDFVEVGSHFGRVQRIGFRASVVRTQDGAEVIVPNGELIGSKVINWSLTDQMRRLSIAVPAAFGTDPNRVIEILNGVARECPLVLAHPSPGAVLEQFGDSALRFQLRCWVRAENFGAARNQLTLAVDRAFQEAGIRIPFQQTDVHLHWPEDFTPEIAGVKNPK